MMTCLELKLVSQKSVNSSLATGYHPGRGEFHIPSCIHVCFDQMSLKNIKNPGGNQYWEDFFQSHSSFKDRLTERCGLSMLHLEGARKKSAEKVCFFHAGPPFTGTTGGGFCKHSER